jgi:hypothetical protein
MFTRCHHLRVAGRRCAGRCASRGGVTRARAESRARSRSSRIVRLKGWRRRDENPRVGCPPVRPDARMRPGPSVRFRSIDIERLLRFLRSDSRRRFDPKIAAADAIETTNDCSSERASMSGGWPMSRDGGSRLANGLLPRDSFAERALLNRRCCEGFRPPDSRRRSSSGRHPKPFTIPEVGGLIQSLRRRGRLLRTRRDRTARPVSIKRPSQDSERQSPWPDR